VNFREYILKIALSRSIFKKHFQPKMHQIVFGSHSWIKGSLLLSKGNGKGVERGKKKRMGREGGNGKGRREGEGGEGKGRGTPFMDTRYTPA